MNKPTTNWHTTQFITNSLRQYLRKKGFRLDQPGEQHSFQSDHAIVCSRLLSREFIEIRGTITKGTETETEEQIEKNSFTGLMHFLFDMMLMPVGFFTSLNKEGGEIRRCFCLPDLNHYRKILEKLSEYFSLNEMHLKIYLINENGSVDVFYLNPGKKQGDKSD